METILTGIRSNEEPTLGNYLGGMLPMIKLQKEYANEYAFNMFVPDLHSFTTPIDHSLLYDNTIHNLRYFVAAGLDLAAENTLIYRQSFVPAHSELTVILNNFVYFGELSRMTQFKEKSDGQSNVSAGLFDYPVLMAADILLYKAKWIPVGDDQKQHIELVRDIATRFNNKFGDVFVVPESWEKQFEFTHMEQGIRVRSLSDPSKKMSKSVSDPKGTILLSDDPEVASRKVLSATTDSLGSVNFDWLNQPGITNLIQILALLTDREISDVANEWKGVTAYGDLKAAVAEAVSIFLTSFQARYETTSADAIESKLMQDEKIVSVTANETLRDVQAAVGLRTKQSA